MGKDLRRKELGKGISQEKSGLYVARFVDRFGKRQSKRFKKCQEARQWIADSTYLDKSSNPLFPQNMIVDAWYHYWIEMKKKTLRAGTIDVYVTRYENNIKNVIGNMKIVDVKPLHIQMILTKMADEGYHSGTISQARIIAYSLFQTAFDNDIILSNPVKKIKKCDIGKPADPKDALSVIEQEKFVACIKDHKYENQWLICLLTGIRVGELIGLQWQDIDFDNRLLHVNRTMSYKHSDWCTSPGKSANSIRTIPLTDDAVEVLKRQKQKISQMKVIPMQYKEYVFIDEDGLIKQSTYHASLKWACKKAGIRRISMHVLRHTFASRCISAGMTIKTVQMLLGHFSISLTMDRYVHVSEDDKIREMGKVTELLKVI